MPFISYRIGATDISQDQIDALIKQTSQLMTNVMNKKPERVTVQISLEAPTLWSAGGKLVSQIEGCSVRMSIDITAGTNSIGEKEDMIAASDLMLNEILNTNSDAVYVIINEIPGESWGKDGVTLSDISKADRMAARSSAN